MCYTSRRPRVLGVLRPAPGVWWCAGYSDDHGDDRDIAREMRDGRVGRRGDALAAASPRGAAAGRRGVVCRVCRTADECRYRLQLSSSAGRQRCRRNIALTLGVHRFRVFGTNRPQVVSARLGRSLLVTNAMGAPAATSPPSLPLLKPLLICPLPPPRSTRFRHALRPSASRASASAIAPVCTCHYRTSPPALRRREHSRT